MHTQSGLVAKAAGAVPAGQAVASMAALRRSGFSVAAVRAQLDAHRWQRVGTAVVLHNGAIHPDELPALALLNCGPRAALTAFTAACLRGLEGWARDEIHVLVPAGARIRRVAGLPLHIHWSGNWAAEPVFDGIHALAPSLVLAAATFCSPRPACGLLAAAVQQRLVTAGELRSVVEASPRVRHRATLRLAIEDIGQGAQALSEIDFGQLCRRHGLPQPRRAVRPPPIPGRRMDHRHRPPPGRRGRWGAASRAAPVVGRPASAERAGDRR